MSDEPIVGYADKEEFEWWLKMQGEARTRDLTVNSFPLYPLKSGKEVCLKLELYEHPEEDLEF